MKKIIIVFALTVFALVSAFAIGLTARVEILTNFIEINTEDIDKSFALIAPDRAIPFDFDESKIEIKLATDFFGGMVSIAVDDLGQGKGVSTSHTQLLTNFSAWAKFGAFQIKIGDFDDRLSKNAQRSLIAKYWLGILRYNGVMNKEDIFREHIEGDRLDMFVADYALKSVKFSFMLNHMASNIVHLGGRVYANIGDVVNLTATVRYNDGGRFNTFILNGDELKPTDMRNTTVGVFAQFPNLGGLNLLVGYTADIWENKKTDATGLSSGIDLRAQIPVGIFTLATHNNLSIYKPTSNASDKYITGGTATKPTTGFVYNAPDDFGKNVMLLYNEVKALMPLSEAMGVTMALRSSYYDNPNDGRSTQTTETFYNLDILFGFIYTFSRGIRMETGLNVMHLANNQSDVMLEIPFKFSYWL